MMLTIKKLSMAFLMSMLLIGTGYSLSFQMPDGNNSILGQLQQSRVSWGDNFYKIGRRFDIGYDAMAAANDKYNPHELPLFYHVIVPSQFMLPPGAREGIVVNVAEKRLFYYNPLNNQVMTFPVGIGKQGWDTILGKLTIIEKIVNPTWYAPKDILQELAKEGYTNVPSQIPEGPQDPLGAFALRLSNPEYLIHGTNDPSSIGTQASSGCIRLYPEDIAQLFAVVPQGTKVRIIDAPFEIGWNKTSLYLVAFQPLMQDPPLDLNQIDSQILQETQGINVNINWRKVAYTALIQNGIPTKIGNVETL